MYWITREGKKLKISEMETSHIKNCISLMEKKYPSLKEEEDIVDEFDAIPPFLAQCIYIEMQEELNKRS
jgi:hypothetical protein